MTHKVTVKGQLGTATVTGGAILLTISTRYGNISLPVRGFQLDELEDGPMPEGFLDIDIDINLPDYIVS